MHLLVRIALLRLLGFSVIGDDVYPEFLDKNQPIGLESIKGYLKQNCNYPVETKIIDLHQEEWHPFLRKVMLNRADSRVVLKDLFDRLELTDFDIIGLSAPMSSEKTLFLFLRFLTNDPEYSNKIIIVGNLCATFCYDQILEDYPTVFCCVGSGEECMLALGHYVFTTKTEGREEKDKLKTRERLSTALLSKALTVPNLFFSCNGTIKRQRQSSLMRGQEIYFYPSTSTQSIVEARGGSMRAQSSRGCDFHCGFCVVNQVFGLENRIEFPISCVLKYVREVAENSDKEEVRVDFIDDEFLGHPVDVERMTILFRGIQKISKQLGKKITFSFAANSNGCRFDDNSQGDKKRDLWFLAKQSGLRKVFLGLESNVPNQLRRYNKYGSSYSNEQAINFLRDDLRVRIEVAMILVDYEMGQDWREELLANFSFLRRHGLHTERALLIQVVKPLRFSGLFEKYRAKGILLEQAVRYSPVWNARFLNPEVERFISIFESFSSKKEPLYQLKYRLKQDLLFDLGSEEERIKKSYKDKLAELDFFFFESLLKQWDKPQMREKLEKQLIMKRKAVLAELQKSIAGGRITGYAGYYQKLIEALLNQP